MLRIKKTQRAPAWERVKNWTGGWRVWVTVLLLFITLGIVVQSVVQAQWTSPQPSLLLVLVLAIGTTWMFVRSRLPVAVVHLLLLIIGFAVTFWQGLGLFPSTPSGSSLVQLFHFLDSLWQMLIKGSAVESTAHLALFLVLLTWILGYVSTWFALRKQNAWMGVSLAAIAILVNLSNLPGKYYIYFFFFVLAAITLIVWINFSRNRTVISVSGGLKKHGLVYFTASLVCLGFIASLLIWPLPDFNLSQTSPVVGVKVFWQDKVQNHLNNILSGVPAHLPIIYASDQKELVFNSYADSKDEEIQFTVTSSRPYYWRTSAYDTYISSGWTNEDVSELPLDKNTLTTESQNNKQRLQINYKVTAQLKTNVILVAGDFNESDTPVEVSTISDHGPEIDTETIAAIVSVYQLNPGQHYDITASVSTASQEQLATAGTIYPSWVTANYLQLPSSLPERVIQLSRRISGRTENPYAKVLAVKQYLSGMTYSQENSALPAGSDGVYHFLFTTKTGNCGYFASAAVVLLRAAGVPARLAVGYLSDEWDAASMTNTIRAKNAHAWPEVYFPGYGWIDFEVTPGNIALPNNSQNMAPEPVVSDENTINPDYGPYWYNTGTNALPGTGSNPPQTVSIHRISVIIPLTIIFIILGITGLYLFKEFIRARLYSYGVLRGKPDFATEIYRKTCFVLRWFGVRPLPQETPYEFQERLIKAFPESAVDIRQIVQSYTEVRFSPRKILGNGREIDDQKAWVEFYRKALKNLFRKKWLQLLGGTDHQHQLQ